MTKGPVGILLGDMGYFPCSLSLTATSPRALLAFLRVLRYEQLDKMVGEPELPATSTTQLMWIRCISRLFHKHFRERD